MQAIRIALVGDYSDAVVAHRAIPRALELAGAFVGCRPQWEWLSTESLEADPGSLLAAYESTWCVPGSPYRSEAGALAAIRYARESGKPFLGTCGGCQHALLEYARNVLGLSGAEHAEVNPGARLPLISPLSCALVEQDGTIQLEKGSKISGIYGSDAIREQYHCRYGLNPRLEHLLDRSDLRITGRDPGGEARVMEMAGKGFYVLTQFQPERAALTGRVPPVVAAFIEASLGRA